MVSKSVVLANMERHGEAKAILEHVLECYKEYKEEGIVRVLEFARQALTEMEEEEKD